ncbi:MAG: prepilin-type N-terminal cleavage/methylation domain-containing protein [Planctomycetota bacterium]
MRTTCIRRAGVSLIELMVAMTIASTMVTITTTWVIRVFGVHRQARLNVAWQQTALRLDRDLRDDVRRSERMKVEDSALLLQSKDVRTRYQFHGDVVRREFHRNDTITKRDAYPLPQNATVAIDVTRDVATFTIQRRHSQMSGETEPESRTLFRCVQTSVPARRVDSSDLPREDAV